MKPKGICLHTPEVLALLTEGQVTIERPIKDLPDRIESITCIPGHDKPGEYVVVSETEPRYALKCPHGAVGQTLWIKETWGAKWNEETSSVSLIREERAYKASGGTAYRDCWRLAHHMPQWASRLQAQLSNVCVTQNAQGGWMWVLTLTRKDKSE